MILNLKSPSIPGWTFTDTYLDSSFQLLKLINERPPEEVFDFGLFQKKYADEYNIKSSRVRELSSWFVVFGILRSYGNKKEKFTYQEFGNRKNFKSFWDFLIIRDFVKKNEGLKKDKELEIKDLEVIFHELVFEFISEAISRRDKKGEIFLKPIQLLEKVQYLTKEEFYIVMDGVVTEKSINELITLIMEYREGKFSIKQEKKSNSYNYIRKFLLDALIISQVKNSNKIFPNRAGRYEEIVVKNGK